MCCFVVVKLALLEELSAIINSSSVIYVSTGPRWGLFFLSTQWPKLASREEERWRLVPLSLIVVTEVGDNRCVQGAQMVQRLQSEIDPRASSLEP